MKPEIQKALRKQTPPTKGDRRASVKVKRPTKANKTQAPAQPAAKSKAPEAKASKE